MGRRMSIYSLVGEGVRRGRMGTWASARNVARRQGPDDPDGGPDDPAIVWMIREGARMIRLHEKPLSIVSVVIQMIWRGTRMIHLGPNDPDGGPDVRASFSRCSVFFTFLPSSLPCFPRGWCRRTLALALLLDIRDVPTIPMHAHGRSVK